MRGANCRNGSRHLHRQFHLSHGGCAQCARLADAAGGAGLALDARSMRFALVFECAAFSPGGSRRVDTRPRADRPRLGDISIERDVSVGKILWLASYPRSGNTRLRAFLHNLLRGSGQPYDMNRLQDFPLIDSDARWYRPFDPRPPTDLTKEEVAALRPKAHAAMTGAFPDTVIVKTHNAMVEDRGTPMITLEHTAGAIYIVRDPLDVAVSYSHHFGAPLA